jgi:hypothetical protein
LIRTEKAMPYLFFAITLGFFMTRIILSFLFYVVFTSVGLIARLVNRDMLDQQYDADATSYWKKHERPKDRRQHLERQF